MDPLLDAEDIFEELSCIVDPEKPMFTLADLQVVTQDRCHISYSEPLSTSIETVVNAAGISVKRYPKRIATVEVLLKPTVPHCSLMMIIGLSVRAKLIYDLPRNNTIWRVRLRLVDGSHLQQQDIEKQINDKERVFAALENPMVAKQVKKLLNPLEEAA